MFFPSFVQDSLIYSWPCIHFYFRVSRFLKIPGKFKWVINGKIILTNKNIYDRCIYALYFNCVLVTFSLLTAVTLSQLAIKLVYRDAFCLSSDYKEVLVLLCHPTERVPKIDTNCHIFDRFLSISSKIHNLLGLFNIYWKSVPSTIRNFQDCL